MFVSYPMKITYFIFYPALMLLNGTSNLLLKAVGITPANGHTSISAEELYHMTRQSGASGAIDTDQSQLLTNVFTFSDRVASEIMVPHNRVVYVDVDATIDEILQLVLTSGHSRIPLVEESLDKVIGVLHIKDLLPHISNNTVPDDIRKLARTPIFVSEFMPAQKILVELKHQRTHLAIVVDEYGGTSGVVTIEDVLEELVGDIQDEFDTEVQVIQKSDNGYIIDGSASLFEVFRTLNLGEPDSDADTLNGFMMEYLEHIPVVNDTLTIDGWQFKVLSMDGLRIGKLEAIRLEQETESK
jgi:CBS domain containing-hemolysin-like protein